MANPARPPGIGPVPPEIVERGTELLLAGMPETRVAAEVGVSVDTVSRWALKPTVAEARARAREACEARSALERAHVREASAAALTAMTARMREVADSLLGTEYGLAGRRLWLDMWVKLADRCGLAPVQAVVTADATPRSNWTPEQSEQLSRQLARQLGLGPVIDCELGHETAQDGTAPVDGRQTPGERT